MAHQDDGLVEPLVADMRAGDKKMPLQRGQRMLITASRRW
jgi:hypothetical protein